MSNSSADGHDSTKATIKKNCRALLWQFFQRMRDSDYGKKDQKIFRISSGSYVSDDGIWISWTQCDLRVCEASNDSNLFHLSALLKESR